MWLEVAAWMKKPGRPCHGTRSTSLRFESNYLKKAQNRNFFTTRVRAELTAAQTT
jgi:hypothetical protein